MIRQVSPAAALVMCFSAAALSAEEPNTQIRYALRGGASYSDNVFLQPSDSERDSASVFTGLQVNGSKPKGRLIYDLGIDLTANEYFSVDDAQELQGRAALRGRYDLIPESFGWNASVGYDQYRKDLLNSLGPGNTESVVSLSTGPTLRFAISSQTHAVLDAQYSRVDYAIRNFDNEAVGGKATLIRQMDSKWSMGVGVSADGVSYLSESSMTDGYDRREAFVKTDVKGVRTTSGLEVGYSRFSDGESKDSGLLLRGRFERRMTPALAASLSAAHEYAGNDQIYGGLTNTSVGGLGAHDETPVTAGARKNTRVGLGISYNRPRTSFLATLSHVKEDGRISGADVRYYDEFRTNLTRQLSPRLRSTFDITLAEDDLAASPASAERLIGAAIDWSAGRALGVGVRIQHRHRGSTSASSGYSEMSGNLYVSYSSRDDRSK